MSITPAQVKELREKTGAGMMDCKKALADANGDMDTALDNLRKQGLATAKKKSGRAAAEGVIGYYTNDDSTAGVLLEVNCETDFVTKTDDFQTYVTKLTDIVREKNPGDMDAFMACTYDGGTVKDAQTAIVAKIGENIGARRFARWESNGSGQKVAQYIHAGNKIGVMVRFDDPEGKLDMTLAREVAMHVAAMHPSYVRAEDIPTPEMEKEKEIMLAQMADLKKPPEVMEKIVQGKLAKYAKEVCLNDQLFVRDPEGKATVAGALKKMDDKINVVEFVRFQVGEGLEKKKD